MKTLSRRLARPAALLAGSLVLLLAACVFAPGRFTSQLDLHRDRTFAFRYTGEILMVPLMKGEKDAFAPQACHDEESFEERVCSADELAQQKADWDKQQEEKRKSDAQTAQMLLGGIDPANPESGRELADRLRRQAGWNKVEYLGDGKFDVEFAMAGRLDHDFVFPTLEGFPMSNAFVQVFVRRDGSVRVEAPGFGPPAGAAAMGGMMAGMAKDAGAGDGPTQKADGSFTVVTNGTILANNTDEGPVAAPTGSGRSLMWKVNPRTPAAPTALVKLVR